MRDLLNRSNERWALLKTSERPNTRLAIFVHGFRGSYLTTWGQLPELLRVNADADPAFAPWDYLFIGYDSRRIDTYLDISRLLLSHWRLAAGGERPFERPYTGFALFGHSLGTLGIRQMLCAWSEHGPDTLNAVHSITLFGTPLNGSSLAMFAVGYPIKRALKPRNPQLRMLKAWSKGAHAVRPWPGVYVILGQDDRVVGDDYAELVEWTGDRSVDVTTLDHGDLVKPGEWTGAAAIAFLARALR
jgi:pimeloyl-ACP methyl ester carboxylesterase